MSVYFLCLWLLLVVGTPGTNSMPEEVLMSAVFLYRDKVSLDHDKPICANPIDEKTTGQTHYSTSRIFPLVNVTELSKRTLDLAVVVQSDELFNVTRMSPTNMVFLFLNEAQLPSIAKLPVVTGTRIFVSSDEDFGRLLAAAAEGHIFVKIYDDEIKTQSFVNTFLVVLLVNVCAVSSLLFGCWMAYLNREKLLEELKTRSSMLGQSKCASYLAVGGLVVIASSMLLLYYFFYDITVYMAIALFCFLGAMSIAYVLTFWIKRLCVPNEKRLALNFHIRNRQFSYKFSIINITLLPLGIAYMIVWVVYRNDPDIGWPMQTVTGVFLIAYLLSVSIPLPSLRIITILYLAFVFYDIFFVFITKAFWSHPTPDPSTVTEATLIRAARSADSHGFMEAVALGTAGRSGESIPATFRWRLHQTVGQYGCSYRDDRMLLGFGDAVIPGLLSAFLIFYDALWEIKYLRHFVASFIGYVVGIVLAFVVSMSTQSAQPALIYLCPCTLGLAVLTAAIFGGKSELARLWNGQLPMPLEPPAYTTTPEEQDYPKYTDSVFLFQSDVTTNTTDRPPMTTGDVIGQVHASTNWAAKFPRYVRD
ncbi:putative signal peptide peptidase 2A [Fasciola hepatica]|uniref:Signal peptide peptidase 2A n=1 Tax=Fasciola hepatica TaxID=6192 RepID=A0A4E0R1K6_FASHE|nr:putative signal peptide peptidase 2A [Fasciola hepatica]